MKIINSMITLALLLVPAMALSSKVTKEYALVTGTSIGKYAKPGAPVDITYSSEHVETGEVSKVDIELTTYLKKGTVKVSISMDKELINNTINLANSAFVLTQKSKTYPLHLEVSTLKDGIYYVRVLVAMEKKGMRSFAVPIYVGDGKIKNKKPIQKIKSGENISISHAIETIE